MLKFIAHRGQVFFVKLTADQVLVLIGLRAHVWLTCRQRDKIVWKPVKANPGLKVNRIITFSFIQMFNCFVCMMIIETQYRRPNNIQKTSAQSSKTQIKILLFSGLA